jgi:hypothetical protein
MGLATLGVRGAGQPRPVRGRVPEAASVSRASSDDAASQPSGAYPPAAYDYPYVEWAGPGPLTDAELDDAIVRLVRAYPGRLGRPRIAHILVGHRGRKLKAKYSHLPDYGRDRFVSLEQVRHRVAQLLQAGRLKQRGENPPRLFPAGGTRSRPKRGR